MLTALQIWDRRVTNGQKDLHWALERHDVHSVQCIRVFEASGESRPPNTFALHVPPPAAGAAGLMSRVSARAWRLGWYRFERFIARHLAEVRPDVMHAHFGTTGWKISAFAERHRIPLVVSFYGVDVSAIVRDPAWQRRYRDLFRRAARLAVLCDAAADRLAALGCPREKIRVWNHPLDLDAYTFACHPPGRPLRLIIGARFVEKKGYPFLLQAVADLVRAGRDVTLTAVGYGGGRRQVEADGARLGLGDRLRIVDSSGVGDFDRFYGDLLHQHDVFVLPSTTARSGDDEGGPALSLVLAQAAGLPVICTPFVGSERSVIDNETGLLCRQDDSQSLASRIAEMADHPDLGARLAASANTLVRSTFGLDTQAVGMSAIYHEAVARP